MGNYPKTPFSIIIDGSCYTIHEQDKNKFFITHETPRNHVSSLVETGIFVFSPEKNWHVAGESNINQRHRAKIFHTIESEIML